MSVEFPSHSDGPNMRSVIPLSLAQIDELTRQHQQQPQPPPTHHSTSNINKKQQQLLKMIREQSSDSDSMCSAAAATPTTALFSNDNNDVASAATMMTMNTTAAASASASRQSGSRRSSVGDAMTATGGGGGGDDDDDDDEAELDDDATPDGVPWTYSPPPLLQKNKFDFLVDDDDPSRGLFCRFSSQFCSGNLAGATRTGPTSFDLRVANDCMGTPVQTNNRTWFFFSVTGVPHGTTLTFNLTQLPFCKTYLYGYTPCVAVEPIRPGFVRMPGTVNMTPAALPPGVNPKVPKNPKAGGGSPNPQYCNISFDFTFDAVARTPQQQVLLDAAIAKQQQQQQQQTSAAEFSSPLTYYFAFCHPYSYDKLQRHLNTWSTNFAPEPPAGRPIPHPIMYREQLTQSLDGNRVDLITITARPNSNSKTSTTTSPGSSPASKAKKQQQQQHEQQQQNQQPQHEPCFGPEGCLPVSSSQQQQQQQQRPPIFPGRRYVFLAARVHPGEVPASYVMHGCIDFLLNQDDPRAAALRENFVFVIVPMVNPDGVVRGHMRADPCGCNLNRVYKNPSRDRHPTVWAIRELMLSLGRTGKLALYIDMHAHQNKRGAFFYGNAMPAAKQVENLLYTKLISMNTPFFGFNDCNFTSSNMYSLGKTNMCKDGSGRVTLFLETGTVHSYTLECNSVIGPPVNHVAALPRMHAASSSSSSQQQQQQQQQPYVASDCEERPGGGQCPRYTPSTFYDISRALLVSLLDLHALNPACRLVNTDFKTVQNVRAFIGAAIYNDAVEQARKKRNEFVITKDDPQLDVDGDGPVTSPFGQKLPIPATTTCGDIATLQQYQVAARQFMVMPLRTRLGQQGGSFSMASASSSSSSFGPPPPRKSSATRGAMAAAVARKSTAVKATVTNNNVAGSSSSTLTRRASSKQSERRASIV